ncbi:biotin synthase BioB [Phorcysia thermohydrogeniphila]|uniref:Biotin synthase n=1 Tax=Phorcysia thermohydrogeniphila TaxID=936138 RepID=A0A4R1GJN8_9BACT|nr:biotin synthase BioB [Phorcysia thermohydrogeniphila]TCK04482.1 biotin synthase [Phorcysia thermohydrogeniphila]
MREEILDVLNCRVEKFYDYLHKATSLRFQHFGRQVETCAILNAKSGKCPSDCKFCAQSAKFNVPVKTYPLLPERELTKKALEAFDRGINRFSFVTSGISPNVEEIKVIGKVIETIKSLKPDAIVCASLGQLKKEELKFLRDCGLDRYHHNLETSREFYPHITTVQKWEDRVRTIENAKEVGLSTCCGGIFGLGENDEDVVSMIKTLKELQVDSIPVNFLHPIKGTPLENANFLTPLKCLRILVAIRLSIPEAEIRVCGGREYNLRELQPLILLPANALMVGNYLTTKGRSLEDDIQMIEDLGLESSLKG